MSRSVSGAGREVHHAFIGDVCRHGPDDFDEGIGVDRLAQKKSLYEVATLPPQVLELPFGLYALADHF